MTMETKEKILEAAERRVRKAGFTEMSFRDLAADVGIKSASVHYHFPTKADLGEALVERYTRQFKEKLDQINMDDLFASLDGFVGLYGDALVLQESICLCAIMGAESIGLPSTINRYTKAFFDMNIAWLTRVLADHSIQNAEDIASMIVAALEGGMIVASSSNDRSIFGQISQTAIKCVLTK